MKFVKSLLLITFGFFVSGHMLVQAQNESSENQYDRFGIYANTAPRPDDATPIETSLPLSLKPQASIALIGNTLFERNQNFGHFESMLHQYFPEHQLKVRHLAWSADEISLQPRPDNFADTEQHLLHEKVDVIFAAFGFNESFAGEEGLSKFREQLTGYLKNLKSKAYNGQSAPNIILVSPTGNEDISTVNAAILNNDRLKQYTAIMQEVASEQQVGFVNLLTKSTEAMTAPESELTINGVHLNEAGDKFISELLFEETFGIDAPEVNESLRQAVIDKNHQYFRRFRPLNTFYYTGGRNKTYGYLDFLPAMRNFDLMVANRDQAIWDYMLGKSEKIIIDDSQLPQLPPVDETRGANQWMTAAEEMKAFQLDPRFEINLFAGEEEFPEIANPIQMRWDAQGRLWVSCSTTYPHVYPGQEPNDRLVVLEDTDHDGRADKSTVFADDLHIPLSFVLGKAGVYVSEQPHLSLLRDTDGDLKADKKEILLTGFGTEDSHHSLHDFIWSPEGDLVFRESIFHHSQVETPYGPVRQQNSGWFRFQPENHRLTSFGSYPSTNPWGVTFDDWGQHVASHPIYAAAFHATDPEYPQQHPRPKDLQAYSGTCGHEFIDVPGYPADLQGCFVKARYKPTNRIEFHRWQERDFGYEEEYLGDLLFSTNLSFIPVDLRYGPDAALYICDWYNPIKGHMQYSLRDERRDRNSGRIWRIIPKEMPEVESPDIASSTIPELLDLLKRPESRLRYWIRRELRSRDSTKVQRELTTWLNKLDKADPRYRHHQLEALWLSRNGSFNRFDLLRDLLSCDDHHARAAATQQLRYVSSELEDSATLLNNAANDANSIVRMEAAIAASYVGTEESFMAVLDVFKHPMKAHTEYGILTAMGSAALRPYWENRPEYDIARLMRQAAREKVILEPKPTKVQKQFDRQDNLKSISISTVPERMLFTITDFAVQPGQPVKLVFTNPDATDHNLVIVKPGALAEVGMAANEMAKDPRNAKSDFIPQEKRDLILEATSMVGPNRSSQIDVLRFNAPEEPGVYPYVCTFPGHWIVMNGLMVVASDEAEAQQMLTASQPKTVQEWKFSDFENVPLNRPAEPATDMRGMTAFVKAKCNQCHVVAGHGVNLGPDLLESVKKLRGQKLLQQIIEPSSEMNEKFRNTQFITTEGRVVIGVIVKEDDKAYHIATNLLNPKSLTVLPKKQVDEMIVSKVSPMPVGLVNVLTQDEILDLHAFLESGGKHLPEHMKHHHGEMHDHHTPPK